MLKRVCLRDVGTYLLADDGLLLEHNLSFASNHRVWSGQHVSYPADAKDVAAHVLTPSTTVSYRIEDRQPQRTSDEVDQTHSFNL